MAVMLGFSCWREAPTGSLEVLWGGCEDVGEVCTWAGESRRLSLWTPSRDALTVQVDGQRREVRWEAVDEGQRVTLDLDDAVAGVTVSSEASRESWSIQLGPQPELPGPSEVDCEALPSAPAAYAMALAHCAKARFREASASGDDKAAHTYVDGLVEAADRFDAAGWTTKATQISSAAAYYAGQSGDLDRAGAIVDSMSAVGCAEQRQTAALSRSGLAMRREAYQDAERHLADAERVAHRLGTSEPFIEKLRANLDSHLGDLDAALDVWVGVLEGDAASDSCEHRGGASLARTNVAWLEMLRRRAGLEARPDLEPRELLLAALAKNTRCGSPERNGVVRVNLMYEAWMREDWASVHAHAGALPPSLRPIDRAWADAAHASALLAEAQHARAERVAVDGYGRAVDAGLTTPLPMLAVIAAEAAVERGDTTQARAHLEAGQRALLSVVPHLPASNDPQAFFGVQLSTTPRLVALQVELAVLDGDVERAFQLLRELRIGSSLAVRRRAALASLPPSERGAFERARRDLEEQRTRLADEVAGNWSLSGEELDLARQDQSRVRARLEADLLDALALLPESTASTFRAPRPGELMVAFVPFGERWMAFVADEGAVRLLPGPPDRADEQVLTRSLLRVIWPELEGVERVTILPWGPVHDLDLHVTPLDGERLVDRVDVAWSMDLPTLDAPPDTGRVVAIGDPDGTLPAARLEASTVARLHSATELVGEQATRDATIAAVDGAWAWHFAGHGRLAPERSWRSGLTLSDGRLEVADLLSLEQAPAFTVLSGCETGRAPRRHGVATIGIAQAVLLAGGHVVVASSRPVDDAAAATAMVELLESPTSLVRRLNEVQRASEVGSESGAWRAWIR